MTTIVDIIILLCFGFIISCILFVGCAFIIASKQARKEQEEHDKKMFDDEEFLFSRDIDHDFWND